MMAMGRFDEVMARHSDAELLEIAASTEDTYQAEAIETAKVELAKRNLTPEEKETAEQDLQTKAAERRASEREPLGARAIVPLLFPGFGYLLVAAALRSQGKKRQAEEMRFYGLVGVGLWGGVLLLLVLWSSCATR